LAPMVPNNDESITEWVTRCQEGDQEAFGPLVDHYQAWVFGNIYRRVGNRDKAEELSQEVFLKAFSQIGKFRREASFSTWLFQITRNHCRDFFRRKENRQALALSLEDLNQELALSPKIEAEMARQKASQTLRTAVANLPEIYREALSLRYFSEFSYEEMSKHQNQKISSLKMRVARGLDLLRKILKESML